MSKGKVIEYRGTDIVLSGTSFACDINAGTGVRRLTAPSVVALKKKIDAALTEVFTPFKAVHLSHGFRSDSKVQMVTAVGREIEPGRRRGLQRVSYTVEGDGGRFRIAPENLYSEDQFQAVEAYAKAINAERKRSEEAHERNMAMYRQLKSLKKMDDENG